MPSQWRRICQIAFFCVLLQAGMATVASAQCAGGCDDSNPCTDDICDANLGCLHSDNSAPCTDGNACTTNDFCSGGACVGGSPAPGCSPCQAVAVLPPRGGTFAGTTSGSSTLTGSCGTSSTAPERVYAWTAPFSGTATFKTCGSGTHYDTVLYVRSGSCFGAELACNDDACAIATSSVQGSSVSRQVTAGQTYYIVVDGYRGAAGAYSLTVDPPANCGNGVREGSEECDGADAGACVTGQCRAQCTCVPPATGLPDLTPEITDWRFSFGATVDSGDVAEGCAESTSGVDLLRFGVRVRNNGTANLEFGDPDCPNCLTNPLVVCGNPDFTCSPAEGHNHAHYGNYARYELLSGGQATVIGHKQGFCLLDSECSNPVYSCGFQGISAGCSDVYGSSLGCQYLDITDVPPGDYVLRVTVDPFGRIAELNESNNVVSIPVTIPGGQTNACDGATAVPPEGGVFTGTTSGTGSLSGSCATSTPAPEKVFRWTPSISGTATIQTCGSGGTNFDTVLYLRQGDCASGAQVACNDDTTGCATSSGPNHGSRITPAVTAGQTYFIVVDGYAASSGNFRLTITPPAGSTTGSCSSPTVIPAGGGFFAGSTSGTGALSGSCANTTPAPERVFQWTPSVSGTATIQTCGSSTTNFDTVLYMRAGSCATGTQIACNDDTTGCAASSGPNHASRITPAVTAGQTYFIVVDGYSASSGNFGLSVTPPAASQPTGTCNDPTVIPAEGGVVNGTTSGAGALAGTCGSSAGSPEKVFQWTPSRSGTAAIQTCGAAGTTYDTVLYVRGGSCQGGVELACNDDTDGCAAATRSYHASRVTLNVTAGQTYFVVVDGYNGANGNFQLTVTPPP